MDPATLPSSHTPTARRPSTSAAVLKWIDSSPAQFRAQQRRTKLAASATLPNLRARLAASSSPSGDNLSTPPGSDDVLQREIARMAGDQMMMRSRHSSMVSLRRQREKEIGERLRLAEQELQGLYAEEAERAALRARRDELAVRVEEAEEQLQYVVRDGRMYVGMLRRLLDGLHELRARLTAMAAALEAEVRYAEARGSATDGREEVDGPRRAAPMIAANAMADLLRQTREVQRELDRDAPMWEWMLTQRREELKQRDEEEKAVAAVLMKQDDTSKAVAGDLDEEGETKLKERYTEAVGGGFLTFLRTKKAQARAAELEKRMSRLTGIFGVSSVEQLLPLLSRTHGASPSQSRHALEALAAQQRARLDDARRVHAESRAALDQLRLTGESAGAAGYVTVDGTTDELVGYGGTAEVEALGQRCLAATRRAASLRASQHSSRLVVANVGTCISGLLRVTACADETNRRASLGAPARTDGVADAGSAPEALTESLWLVLQRLIKLMVVVNGANGGAAAERVPATAANAAIQKVMSGMTFDEPKGARRVSQWGGAPAKVMSARRLRAPPSPPARDRSRSPPPGDRSSPEPPTAEEMRAAAAADEAAQTQTFRPQPKGRWSAARRLSATSASRVAFPEAVRLAAQQMGRPETIEATLRRALRPPSEAANVRAAVGGDDEEETMVGGDAAGGDEEEEDEDPRTSMQRFHLVPLPKAGKAAIAAHRLSISAGSSWKSTRDE